VRFWDTSALVPLVIEEPGSTEVRRLLADDADITVWWATTVEYCAAVARGERLERLDAVTARDAYDRLDSLAIAWREIAPSDALRDDARRIVRVHDLRATDAFQLAAAGVAADDHPDSLPFVTLDDRLALAASREGFPILGLD
jgi:predicted nucleic acid-binding protein